MVEDDYEIMSHKDILKLKEEVEKLKKNPLGEPSGNTLPDTINRLEVAMNNMLEIFRLAYTDFKQDDDIIVKRIDPFFDKLERVVDQNERIAQALVAIAEMVKDIKIKVDAINQQQKQPQGPSPVPPLYSQQQMGYPNMQQGMQQGPDFSQMGPLNPPMQGQDQFNPLPTMGAMPPPPGPGFVDKPKKRGLFGK